MYLPHSHACLPAPEDHNNINKIKKKDYTYRRVSNYECPFLAISSFPIVLQAPSKLICTSLYIPNEVNFIKLGPTVIKNMRKSCTIIQFMNEVDT